MSWNQLLLRVFSNWSTLKDGSNNGSVSFRMREKPTYVIPSEKLFLQCPCFIKWKSLWSMDTYGICIASKRDLSSRLAITYPKNTGLPIRFALEIWSLIVQTTNWISKNRLWYYFCFIKIPPVLLRSDKLHNNLWSYCWEIIFISLSDWGEYIRSIARCTSMSTTLWNKQ